MRLTMRPDIDGPVRLVERISVSDAWAINTYAACDFRCIYCITSAQGRSAPRYGFDVVAEQLGRELDEIGAIDRLIVGAFCDVYPGPESRLGVTRRALEVLDERRLGFNLVTKGTTVVRDVDLFAHPDTLIQVSVTSLDGDVLARLEPGASSPSARLAVVHELAARGVRVLVQVSPWIPGVSDVGALRDRVDAAILLQVTPLRLPAYLGGAGRSLRLTQAGVNAAYRREYERVGRLPNVRWSRPPPLDGSPPHIVHNLGRRVVSEWAPAPTAPDPGPRRAWMDR
jgi:DNA repair photolyase